MILFHVGRIIPIYLIEDIAEKAVYTIEEYLAGQFDKYSNNDGKLTPLGKTIINDATNPQHGILVALLSFSHWVYCKYNGKVIV